MEQNVLDLRGFSSADEGASAVHHQLVSDAAAKADDANVQYFFTWNVTEFALWDRSLWDRSWYERRVRLRRSALCGARTEARYGWHRRVEGESCNIVCNRVQVLSPEC